MINIAVFAEQEMRGNDFIHSNDASALLNRRVAVLPNSKNISILTNVSNS